MPANTTRVRIAYGDQPILTTYQRRGRISDLLPWLALAAVAFLVGYAVAIRPWQLNWGATVQEAREPLPGDGLTHGPVTEATRAITVDVPPEAVWPWLVQMGQGRAGLYSYDWLENLIGCDVHSTDRIVPQFQQLKVGDTVRLATERRFPHARLVVAELRPGRALVLRSPVDDTSEQGFRVRYAYSWAFVLNRFDEGSTRLISRARYKMEPRLIGLPAAFVALEPIEFVMTQKMLRGIKERAEGEDSPTS